jgi:hypothetical protein
MSLRSSEMEVKMKKLAVFVVITVLSVFMFAAVVSADGHRWGKFHGVYAMTAQGSAIISTGGFTETEPDVIPHGFIPNEGSHVWGAVDRAYGTWIFKRDGTGTAEGRNFAFDFPPGPPGVGPRARDNDFKFEFEYEIYPGGAIHVWVTAPNKPPNDLTMLEMEGMISPDRKTMTLNNAYTFFNDYTIFMASRVLIWVRNNAKED